jgi:IclR family mhp operon transcriptional activator
MKLEHKSLDRGIAVLEILARNGSCSLAELHALSGISKSSIRRLLATLVERRLVRRSLADGRYRASITMPVSTGVPVPPDFALVVDVALPHVTALTAEVSWPSDIHLLDGDRMRVLDSTRPLSPFHLYRGVVDQTVNIFGSASGMSCLADMPEAAFERIAAHTEGDPRWGLMRYRLTVKQYRRHLEASRRRGYGQRIERYVGNKVFDDGLAAIATPIHRNGHIYGAVSLLWPKAYLEPGAIARQYLDSLKRATRKISEDLERLDSAAAGVTALENS